MSTDGCKQPLLRGGLIGGLVIIGAKLSDLKQSVRVAIRWLHGPPNYLRVAFAKQSHSLHAHPIQRTDCRDLLSRAESQRLDLGVGVLRENR
jgi:hypothetical protein